MKVRLSADDIAKLPKWAQEQLRTSGAARGPKRGKKHVDLADGFLAVWKVFSKLPAPVREYMFHPERKWRFDVCWPDHKLALECDGGTWVKGGHSRGKQQRKDFEKQNAAVALGWRLMRADTDMIKKSPVELIQQIEAVLKAAV